MCGACSLAAATAVGNTSLEAQPLSADSCTTQLPPGDVYAVNAGGIAECGYSKDSHFVSGESISTTHSINTANASEPAPVEIYQEARVGNQFTYSFSHLKPTTTYAIILHFAELRYAQPFKREFNVSINGNVELSDFDIVLQAGERFSAVDEFFLVPSDGNGTIQVDFSTGSAGVPTVNGIEIRSGGG